MLAVPQHEVIDLTDAKAVDVDVVGLDLLAETRAVLEAPEQWSANHGGRPPAPRSMLGR